MVQLKFPFHSRFLILLICLLIQSLGIFPLIALDKAYPDQTWMNYKSSSFNNLQETIKDFLTAENEKAKYIPLKISLLRKRFIPYPT